MRGFVLQLAKNSSLQELVQRFENDELLCNAREPMMLSSAGARLWANSSMLKFLGYEKDEFLRLDFKEIFPKEYWELREKLISTFKNKEDVVQRKNLEIKVIDSSGELHEILLSVNPIFNSDGTFLAGWVTFNDITEQKYLESEAKGFKNKFVHLLESMQLIGLSLDIDGTIREINENGAKLLGWERFELIGKNWFDTCIPLQDRNKLKEFYLLVANNELNDQSEVVGQVLTRDGRILDINWKGTFLRDNEGNATGSISVGENVTEKVKVAEEKERLIQNIISVSRHESIAQLVGGVAHEFNNVLSIILGFNKLAIKSVGNDDEVKLTSYMLEVDKAGKRAAKLIEQLQAYSKKSALQTKEIDIAKETEEMVSLAKSFFPSTVKFELHKKEKVKKFACDLSLFHQSLMNLMINAQEAMEGKGTITIEIQNRTIANAICDSCHKPFSGTFIVLSVRNSGSNISPALKAKIFDPFFSTKPVGQGTGMGLSVVHGFVHSSKGHVIIDNSVSDSVSINLYFPTSQNIDVEEPNFKNQKVEHKKVLVVDDEETLLFLYGRILKNLGIESECFSSPELALKEFQKNPNDFSLIITDQTMPGMLGIELVGEIKKLNPKIHTMLISGYSDVVDNKSSNLIDEYYVKPVDVSVLIGKIKTLFSM